MPAARPASCGWEIRGRRLSLLLALCTLVRDAPLANAEEVILGRAIDLLDERPRRAREPDRPRRARRHRAGPGRAARRRPGQPTRPVPETASPTWCSPSTCCAPARCAGVFDGPTTTPIDLDAPAVSVDISRVGAAGDKLLTAAMLCTWAYGFGMADAAAALAEPASRRRRHYLAVMDELWRALRGAPGLVEYADALTRLNRAKGMARIMITHSLADLDALATEEDRAKARGFVDRCAITVLAGLPPRELARVSQITPLTGPEQELVTSWSAPDSWQPGARHPGRGKYLIKTGERLGIPVELSLVGAEAPLYDTDQAIRPRAGRREPAVSRATGPRAPLSARQPAGMWSVLAAAAGALAARRRAGLGGGAGAAGLAGGHGPAVRHLAVSPTILARRRPAARGRARPHPWSSWPSPRALAGAGRSP